jgi:hypothetical protein
LGPVSLDGLGLGEALLCGLVGIVSDDYYVPRAEGGPDRLLPRSALVGYREWYGAAAPNVGLKMTAEAVGAGIVERELNEPTLRYGVLDPGFARSSRGAAPARDGPSTRQRSFREDRHGRPIRRASRRSGGRRGAICVCMSRPSVRVARGTHEERARRGIRRIPLCRTG